MGKPGSPNPEGEIEKCAYNCDFYAEHAAKYLADEAVPSNATESVVEFDPLSAWCWRSCLGTTLLAVLPVRGASIRSG